MDKIRNTILNIKLKLNEIKMKIKAYLLSPECFDKLFKTMKKMNLISIDLDDIYFGFINSKRHFISMIDCIILWVAVLICLFIFCSFDFWNDQIHLTKYYNQMKQLLFLLNALLITASMLKSDIFLEEHYYNLQSLKFFHYLNYDLKQMHKLNDKHYKILTVLTRLSSLFWFKIYFPLALTVVPLIFVATGILKESFLFDFLILVIYYVDIKIQAIYSSLLSLILITSFYYKYKFDQINKSVRSIASSDSIPSIELWHFINEHNLITIEVNKLNLFIRRSTAVLFVTSGIIEDMFIYLAIYSDNIIHKILLSFLAIAYFFIGFAYCYLISLVSTSAHRSYKIIFSILNKRTTNLRLKIKV